MRSLENLTNEELIRLRWLYLKRALAPAGSQESLSLNQQIESILKEVNLGE